MGMWDELLNQVAETDREVFKKYPKLAAKVDEADTKVSEWERWSAEHFDRTANTTKEALAAMQAKDEEIEALRLLQGSDMNWDDMKANVEATVQTALKNGKVMTADDFRKTLDTEVNSKLMVERQDGSKISLKDAMSNLERGMEITYAKTAHLPSAYLQEFGKEAKPFTMEQLFAHMQEKKLANFEDAYNSMVSPLRDERSKADGIAKEAAIRKEEREKVMQEVSMRHGAMPLDDRGAPAEMSALQRRINENKKVEVAGPKLTPGELGSQAGANDAYQQYLKDQAAGIKPQMVQ
jgi:hypothetical protein